MTAGEMICYKFASQGLIRDLKNKLNWSYDYHG